MDLILRNINSKYVTENFKTGYKRGMFLVEQGIVPDELSEIVKQSKYCTI